MAFELLLPVLRRLDVTPGWAVGFDRLDRRLAQGSHHGLVLLGEWALIRQ